MVFPSLSSNASSCASYSKFKHSNIYRSSACDNAFVNGFNWYSFSRISFSFLFESYECRKRGARNCSFFFTISFLIFFESFSRDNFSQWFFNFALTVFIFSLVVIFLPPLLPLPPPPLFLDDNPEGSFSRPPFRCCCSFSCS